MIYPDRSNRVQALEYVLFLLLLMYSVAERRARQALADADELMELAEESRSFRSTDRRVLERFENIRVVAVDGTRALPDDVDVSERVLDLFDLGVRVVDVESLA